MYKVVLLTNELPPYRRPIIRRLGERSDIELTVLLSTKVEPGRDWEGVEAIPNVDIKIVKNISINTMQRHQHMAMDKPRLIHLPIGVLCDLIKYRPDVVISDEFGFRSVLANIYCRIFNKALILWSGEIPHHAQGASRLQRLVRKHLIPQAHSYLVYGDRAEDYLVESYQVKRELIHHSVQAVDATFWQSQIEKVNVQQLRQTLGLKGRVVLYVGQLISRKGVDCLLQAWSQLEDEYKENNSLVIVGGGSEEKKLQKLALKLATPNVQFMGRRPPEKLGEFYAAADIFVMPSLIEIWGLVANEAMIAGLPVICSQYAGCADELIIENETGSKIDPRDVVAFSCALRYWLNKNLELYRNPIKAHVAHWSYERSEQGFMDAIYQAIDVKAKSTIPA